MANQGEVWVKLFGQTIYGYIKGCKKRSGLKFHRNSLSAIHKGCIAIKYMQEWEMHERDMRSNRRRTYGITRCVFLGQNTTKPNICTTPG